VGRIKPIAHEDELSLVEHLDELRTRLIIVIAAFSFVLAICFWQNHAILDIVNGPLPDGKHPSTFGVSADHRLPGDHLPVLCLRSPGIQ
jgi:hypothetical protein